MKIVVAITGASGTIYARKVLEHLLRAEEVEQIALIVSQMGHKVAQHEGVKLPEHPKITIYDNQDMFAPSASGSAGFDAMVVVPASMGSVGRIASGISSTLIERTADVMLKERRRLIIIPREAPYSLIHLRNMTTLCEAGAMILPASPSFYAHPQSIDDLVESIAERIIAHLGIEQEHYRWGE